MAFYVYPYARHSCVFPTVYLLRILVMLTTLLVNLNVKWAVFKDGGKEEKRKSPTSSPVKCFFIRIHSDAKIDQNTSYVLCNKTISDARRLFMHAHTVSSVANYMARCVSIWIVSSKNLYLCTFHWSLNCNVLFMSSGFHWFCPRHTPWTLIYPLWKSR